MSEWESMFSPKRGGRGKGGCQKKPWQVWSKRKKSRDFMGIMPIIFYRKFYSFFLLLSPSIFSIYFCCVSVQWVVCFHIYLIFFSFLVSFFSLFPCSSLANPYHLTDKSKRIGWWQALVLPLPMLFSSSLAVAAGNSRKLQMHRRMKNEKTGFVVFFDGQGLKKRNDDNNNKTVVRFSFWTQVVARVMLTKGRRGGGEVSYFE